MKHVKTVIIVIIAIVAFTSCSTQKGVHICDYVHNHFAGYGHR